MKLPKIIVVDELPEWILSSDNSAYKPSTNEIWIRKDRLWKDIWHELGHWFGWQLSGRESKLHRWLDRGEPNFH
jgi:hypothetical protein